MKRKRNRFEVIYDILEIIQTHHNSIKPTPLLRYSNLSSQGYKEYHAELIEKEFIREITDKKGRKFLTLTDKGFLYLAKYQNLKGFMEEFDL